MVGLGMVNPVLIPRPDEGTLYCMLSPVQSIQSVHGQNLPLKSAEPQCLNGGLPSVMCVWCLCIYSFDFHHSSPLKREYVTAAVTFKKSSFEATFWLLPSVPVCTEQRGEPSSQLASLLFEIYSKCIRNSWTRAQLSKLPSLPYPQDTSVVVVTFKCHTGLDT